MDGDTTTCPTPWLSTPRIPAQLHQHTTCRLSVGTREGQGITNKASKDLVPEDDYALRIVLLALLPPHHDMPLALKREDNAGRSGEDLRIFRDTHALVATGPCRQLKTLVSLASAAVVTVLVRVVASSASWSVLSGPTLSILF